MEAIRKATISMTITDSADRHLRIKVCKPCWFGNYYLPSPMDVPPVIGIAIPIQMLKS